LEPQASSSRPRGRADATELREAYLKRSKNDANDAAAICEAVTRPSMRFVRHLPEKPGWCRVLARLC
jgi:transposase